MGFSKAEIQWLATRKKLLRDVKRRVGLHLGSLPREVASYQSVYEKEFSGHWRAATKVELVSHLLRSEIVYVSDFHALNQSQKLHLRLLREISQKRQVVLAVEFLETRYQSELELFLKGELSEEAFLDKTQWEKRWGFGWEHYLPLLKYARKHGIKVYGLNKRFRGEGGETLDRRDIHGASCLARLVKKYPDYLKFVIFGDFHLAEGHLPKQVENKLKSPLKRVIIHQNSEKIYFQLAKLGLENRVDLVKLRENCYCVLGSPPWVKWQSYLLHLESAYDREMEDEMDYTDRVVGMCRWMLSDLQLRVGLNTLAVYGSESDRVMEVFTEVLDKKESLLARKLIEGNKTFFIPQAGIGYLSQQTINHGASLAGYYIHAKLAKQSRLYWDMPQDFRSLIWLEVVGYFCSKLVNHRRKTDTLQDIRSFLLSDSGSNQEKDIFSLALDSRMEDLYLLKSRKRQVRKYRPKSKLSYWDVAKLLGGMMGEQLYSGYRMGVVSQVQIKKMLRHPLEGPDFLPFYLDVLRTLEEVPIPFLSKKERL